MNQTKTAGLLVGMTMLFAFIGYSFGGSTGMIFALVVAAGMNLFSWWNSDKMVLRMHRAQPVSREIAPEFYDLVARLAQRANLPMPKVYIIDNPQPNAFATGRNPANAAVAATTGLLNLLNEDEVEGVIAHELAHVKNRDTLTMTVTATLAGAIGMLANFFGFFGGGRDREQGGNPLLGLAMVFIAPLAAGVVQMAISRTREYSADKMGAEISGKPLALASALQKISQVAGRVMNPTAERNPATAHVFIINPLAGRGVDSLFSTHPNVNNRIQALIEIARQMGQLREDGTLVEDGVLQQTMREAPPRGPWS